ncbi:hypothetical protein KQQSB11_100076 [Klebsiella quasipneumoniae subsp. quasipneumoniae]|nr:hypothetical protein KQQSB11_100076 [Klebsiella quasipneumoniae subsp. quasipneumoniae]
MGIGGALGNKDVAFWIANYPYGDLQFFH